MTAVNVQSAFKKDERENNGLESIGKELIENPMTRHVIVAVVETTRIVTDIAAGGTRTPTVRLVQVEPLDGSDAEQGRAMLDAAFRKRTGREDNPAASLFDPVPADASTMADAPAENDPAAGPWPGDTDYPPDNGEAAAASTAGRKRRSSSREDGE